jgi:hypothetical protein
MNLPGTFARRTLLRVLLGAWAAKFLSSRAEAEPGIPVDRLSLENAQPVVSAHRRYRAHAQVHLLAIPIFSRQDVGGGYAVVEEAVSGTQSITGLQFAGGSAPERTRGLNRVGFIQEVVIEQSGCAMESAYFGFMVSSGEKNLDQARKSLQTDSADSVPYSAAYGSGRPGRFDCTLIHTPVPARYNWKVFDQLNGAVRARIGSAPDTTRFEVPLESSSSLPNTFLYSIRRAILSDGPRMTSDIVYNGKRYHLTAEKSPGTPLGRVNGNITEAGGKVNSSFQVWFEKGDSSGLPARIEFHPKSFLTLVFEQEKSDEGPKFSYMLARAGR